MTSFSLNLSSPLFVSRENSKICFLFGNFVTNLRNKYNNNCIFDFYQGILLLVIRHSITGPTMQARLVLRPQTIFPGEDRKGSYHYIVLCYDLNRWSSFYEPRDVFSTRQRIYDGTIFVKIIKDFKRLTFFHKTSIIVVCWGSTTMFIIFWDILIDEQIFFSSQVKQSVIISNTHGIHIFTT